MKGTFIVLEGPDGSGTTSHAKMLAASLITLGKRVFLTGEPTDGPIGKYIRHTLSGGETMPAEALQLLFCADRSMHVQKDILPALEREDIVISDRYYPSTIAYGEALGLDRAWLTDINAHFPTPDILLLALPPIAVCLKRLAEREQLDMLEVDSLQGRVHSAYQRWSREHPEIPVIDTSRDKDAVAVEIRSVVLEHLSRGKDAEHSVVIPKGIASR